MGGYGSSSTGIGGSAVSRQFTDSEKAIDEKIDTHLQATPLTFDTSAGISLGYEWLSQDLAIRSKLSEQLRDEQQMAYAQSERHKLAEQADEQDAEDQEALDGISSLRGYLDQGMDANEARQKVLGSNNNLALNRRFLEGTDALVNGYETPHQKELRQRKEDLDALNTTNDLWSARMTEETRDQTGGIKAAARRNARRMTMQDYQDDTNFIAAKTNRINVEAAYENAERMKGLTSVDNLDALVELNGMMDELELSDVADPRAVAQYASGSKAIMSMVADPAWREIYFREGGVDPKAFGAALNTVTNPQAPAEERRAAETMVHKAAYQWSRDNRRAQSRVEANKTLAEISKDVAEPYEKVDKAMYDILKEDVQDLNDAGKVEAMIAKTRGFMAQFAGDRGANDQLVAKYNGELEKLAADATAKGSKMQAKGVYDRANELLAGFATEIKPAMASQRATTPAAIREAAVKVDSATKAQDSSGFVVGQTYRDANGNSAVYLGNNQWKPQ